MGPMAFLFGVLFADAALPRERLDTPQENVT
jgi:hypothetical protein